MNENERNKRLVLGAKPDERFELYDSASGTKVIVKPFYRAGGDLALMFEAPETIRISRQERRSAENGKRRKGQ